MLEKPNHHPQKHLLFAAIPVKEPFQAPEIQHDELFFVGCQWMIKNEKWTIHINDNSFPFCLVTSTFTSYALTNQSKFISFKYQAELFKHFMMPCNNPIQIFTNMLMAISWFISIALK